MRKLQVLGASPRSDVTGAQTEQIEELRSMSGQHQSAVESAAGIVAKTSPPVSVSLASVAGYQVSEILLWATLIYTVLMIGHKLYRIYVDVFGRGLARNEE